MPIQSRLVYPSQPMLLVVIALPQSQAHIVVSQPMEAGPTTTDPQVSGVQIQPSQVVLQQPLVLGVQQPQASLPFTIMTHNYIGLVYSQLGQAYIGGKKPLNKKSLYQKQQQLLQQPWQPQYQQQQFQQYQPHPRFGQQAYSGLGLVNNAFTQVLVNNPMLGLDKRKCILVLNNNLAPDLLNKLTHIKVTNNEWLMLV